jgi:purine-nucleoside phosphorylase
LILLTGISFYPCLLNFGIRILGDAALLPGGALHYNLPVIAREDGFGKFRDWCDKHAPEHAVILGTGLIFPLPDASARVVEISYDELPGFDKPRVKGHKGVLRLVENNGAAAVVFTGRRHLYEGCNLEEVIRPVRLARDAGIGRLILTNSAGALNPAASVGDVVLLEDFIIPFDIGIRNGRGFDFEPRATADKQMAGGIRRAARIEGIPLRMGVYVFMPGPAYETPAEIRMLRNWGADVVGMSTAPEWWAALDAGMAVAALSLVTNVHSPDAPPPTHEEVLDAARTGGQKLARILHRALFGKGV